MDKNIVFSEFYYYLTLVFPIGLYINFVTNLLNGFNKIDLIVLILASVVSIFIFKLTLNSLMISIEIKKNSIYIDFSMVFNTNRLKIILYENSIIFIFFGLFISFINSFINSTDCKSLFCDGMDIVYCFIGLIVFLSINSYMFYYPMQFINSILDDDKNNKELNSLNIDTNNID